MKWIWMIGMLTLVACNEDFLATRPTDQLGQEEALATDKNIYAAINGMHRKMVAQYMGNQACGGEASMCIVRDCLGEDLLHPNTGNSYYLNILRWADHRNEKSELNEFPFQLYYYQVLQANLILESIDDARITDTVIHLEGVRGEALCFRAWAHFQLVQLYGGRYKNGGDNIQPGITYRKGSSPKPLPRNSVEDCYAYIHQDLDRAIVCLEDYIAVNVTHFSLKVAYGLKSRVLLAQQNYTEAARYARLAIGLAESEGSRLMDQTECLNGFCKIISRTHEALWAANTQDDQTISFFSFYAYMSWNFNSAAIRLTPSCINSALYARLAPSDIRTKWWDPTGAMAGPAPDYKKIAYQNRKFEVDNIRISAGDFAYMRLAELYLTEAEALARSGQQPEARRVLYDFVVTRDPDYQLSANSGEALCEEIMTHRRLELWGEGFRFTDLKRLDLPLNRKNTNYPEAVARVTEVPAGDVRWQWLIPDNEVRVSLGVVIQNE